MPGKPLLPPTTDNHELWARSAARFQDTFGAALNAHRTAVGLPVVEDVRSHMFGQRPWLAADPTLAPWPDAEDDSVFQPGAWVWKDERPLPPEVERFMEAGEPPIYFGFGSMQRMPQDLGEMVATAARALGRRAILSKGWGTVSLGNQGSDCLSIEETNLQALFGRVAAVVHHGGAGTTTTAAMAGVPQVVMPQVYDQHYFAQRVSDLGIGIPYTTAALSVDSLTSAVHQVLRPDLALRAKSFAGLLRRDGAQVAAQHLVAQSLRS